MWRRGGTRQATPPIRVYARFAGLCRPAVANACPNIRSFEPIPAASSSLDHLGVDDATPDMLLRGDVVHHFQQHLLDSGAQRAGAGARGQGALRDRIQPVRGELQLHMVERISRPNLKTLTYEYTIDDPGAYTKPWTGRWTITETTPSKWIAGGEMFEYICQDSR